MMESHASLKWRTLRFFGLVAQEAPPAPQILKELVVELQDLGRSSKHIGALRRDLGKFVARFPRLETATPSELSAYLRGISAHVGPRRRDNVRNELVELFRFARDRDYLPEERRTAAERIKQIKAPYDIVTWSPGEAKILLEHISKEWLPFAVLSLFAGLRSSEIFRLDWEAFKWHLRDEQGRPAPAIAVMRKIARKIRRDRLVPILPNLTAWLEPYRYRVGLVYPGSFKSNENALSREMIRLRRATGLPRKPNAARHSFGSYRVAIVKDCGQVAVEIGSSPRKLREHYNNPQSEETAREYFSLMPPSRENVVPIPLPLEFAAVPVAK